MKLQGTVKYPIQAFLKRYRGRFKRAVKVVFTKNIEEAITYLDFSNQQPPEAHQEHECDGGLFKVVKRGIRVVGVFSNKEPGQLGHGGDVQDDCSSAQRISLRHYMNIALPGITDRDPQIQHGCKVRW